MQRPGLGPALSMRLNRGSAGHGLRRLLEAHPLLVASIFIAVGSGRIAATYQVFSFTIDEPGHFACGLEYLSKHVYRYLTEQPPLARAAIALPPYLAGARPLGGEEYNTEGRNVILQSPCPNRTLALMRLGILPFFWLACGVVYVWCRRHFPPTVAPFAVALFSLLPPVLAHAGLACTDMALAACLGAAFLSLVLWAESPNWKFGALLGAAAALAVLSKFTALLYLPAAATLALLLYSAAERPGLRKLAPMLRARIASFALAVLVGALVVWAGYLFSFGKVPAWNVSLPAPEFFDGLLVALSHNRRGHPSYLLGHYSLKGWWYYFPVALAVKTPIAFLVLTALGTYTCCRKFSQAARGLPLAFSLGILLPAMAGNVDIGVRHILPVYIGLSVLAAVGLDRLLTPTEPRPSGSGFLGPAAAIVLLLWIAVAGAICHPDYLSYFNEFAGRDPAGILVDSNLDWGQDTKRLGQRLRQLGVQEVSVMLIEPLTLPLRTEEAVRRFYALPRIKPVADASSPGEGWSVLSPTIANTLGLSFKPWWERMPPTEKVGALWLYKIPPRRRHINHASIQQKVEKVHVLDHVESVAINGGEQCRQAAHRQKRDQFQAPALRDVPGANPSPRGQQRPPGQCEHQPLVHIRQNVFVKTAPQVERTALCRRRQPRGWLEISIPVPPQERDLGQQSVQAPPHPRRSQHVETQNGKRVHARQHSRSGDLRKVGPGTPRPGPRVFGELWIEPQRPQVRLGVLRIRQDPVKNHAVSIRLPPVTRHRGHVVRRAREQAAPARHRRQPGALRRRPHPQPQSEESQQQPDRRILGLRQYPQRRP